MTENHEASKPWITMEEVALYKAWIDVSENNIRGNAMKRRGFWFAVLDYFGKEMREHVRGYDANTSKWKNRVHLAHGALDLNEEADGYGEEPISGKASNMLVGEKIKEQQESYIQLKNRVFKINETVNREASELKREELAL
ncbi:hypothetical protein Tco_0324767 [Tanacetum coccineum]